MARNEQAPTREEIKGNGGDVEVHRHHPAYAMIGASRINGHTTLFGSPIKHNGFVRIRIQGAHEVTSLHREWHFAHEAIVEVDVSEAQWAAFVSTMNVGSGVPCTVRYSRDGNIVDRPEIIDDDNWAEKQGQDIKRKVTQDMAKLLKACADLRGLMSKPSIKKGDLEPILSNLLQAVEHAPSNYQFAQQSLVENAEHLVQTAKAEVTAMVTRLAMQFPQLENAAPQLQIEGKSEDR